MDHRQLLKNSGLTTKEVSEKLGIGLRTVQNYINGTQKITPSIKKLIRYEFAEYLPEEERLQSTFNGPATSSNGALESLQKENETLKAKAARVDGLEEIISLQKRNIELLEDQLALYKNTAAGGQSKPA